MKQYILIALLLYGQNFLFLMQEFSLVDFFLILTLVIFISKSKYYKQILALWFGLYFIHFSFISYFGTYITSSDIYLFFTHFFESYETFVETIDMYFLAALVFLVSVSILFKIELQKSKVKALHLLLLIAILGVVAFTKTNDASFLLLKSFYNTVHLKSYEIEKKQIQMKKPLRKTDLNVVLLIGESMRAKEFQDNSYPMFEDYFYKTIYSGATSTDVSLPLLFNGAKRATEIDFSNNLFSLAKQNGYKTHFITAQSKKSMKYIELFMRRESINSYEILGSRDDADLVKNLKIVEFKKGEKNFFVMQMQGEHSPYIYYPTYKKSTIKEQYRDSMKYSNKQILEMIKYFETIDEKVVFIFISDHGELLGERGKLGHNRFEKEIYRVPLVVYSNFKSQKLYEKIESHNGVYNYIHYLLGYSNKPQYTDENIRVNGSMISEEDGFRIMKERVKHQ